VGVECLDQLGEVGERTGQPIDLIDDDNVDPSGLDIDEQFLQSRSIHRTAGKTAIVVTVPDLVVRNAAWRSVRPRTTRSAAGGAAGDSDEPRNARQRIAPKATFYWER
jgi:hypothetical protein